MESNSKLSIGEQRVRTEFNPSKNSLVDQIKQKSAELINVCQSGKQAIELNNLSDEQKTEEARLWWLAETAFEEAAMWAVKAATFGL